MKKLVNGIEIELNQEEIIQRQIDEQNLLNARNFLNEKLNNEKQRKQSAISKLKAIGLTDEEINSLLGK